VPVELWVTRELPLIFPLIVPLPFPCTTN